MLQDNIQDKIIIPVAPKQMFLTCRINTTGKPSKLASPAGGVRQQLWATPPMLGRDWLIQSHPV
jgi:hypothetical protein